jgi:hypothetical protein
VEADDHDREDAIERELLQDILPWSPWKAAVVALKRKQNDRSLIRDATEDLNEDDSFAFLWEVGELLRSTTKQLGADPEEAEFRQGLKSLAQRPEGCRLLGSVAHFIEREVLQDTLSFHLLPLPGSRARWLPKVQVIEDSPVLDPETGATLEAGDDAELCRTGDTLRLIQSRSAKPSIAAVLASMQTGTGSAEDLRLVRAGQGPRLISARVVTEVNIADAEVLEKVDSERDAEPAGEPADKGGPATPAPASSAAVEASSIVGESTTLFEGLGSLRHKQDGVDLYARWEKRYIKLSAEGLSFFSKSEDGGGDEILTKTVSSTSEVFLRFLDHVYMGGRNLVETFYEMDTDNDQELDEEELYEAFQNAGLSLDRGQISEVRMVLDVDGDSNGKVSITEFMEKVTRVSEEWKESWHASFKAYSNPAGTIEMQDARCTLEEGKDALKIFSRGYEYEMRAGSPAQAASWAQSIRECLVAGSDSSAREDSQPTPAMYQSTPQQTGVGPTTAEDEESQVAPASGAFRALREIATMYTAQDGDGARQFMEEFVAEKIGACQKPACMTPIYKTMRLELAKELGGLAAAAHQCNATECLAAVLNALQILCTDPQAVVREECARMLPTFCKCHSHSVYESVAEAYSQLAKDEHTAPRKSLLRHTQALAEGFVQNGGRTPPAKLLEGFVSSVQTVVQVLRDYPAESEQEQRDVKAIVEATLDACLALSKAAGRARWPEIAEGLETLLKITQGEGCTQEAAGVVVGQVAKRLHIFADELQSERDVSASQQSESRSKTLLMAAEVCMSGNCPKNEQHQFHCRLAKLLWALDEKDRKPEWLDKMVGAYDRHLNARRTDMTADPVGRYQSFVDIRRGGGGHIEDQLKAVQQVAEREEANSQQHELAHVLAFNFPASIMLICKKENEETGFDMSKWKAASTRNGYEHTLQHVHRELVR